MALAIDLSTPAFASAISGNVATTAPFTPPAGAVLIAIGDHDTAGGNATNSSAVTDSQGLAWTIQATRSKGSDGGAAQNGHVQVSSAVVASSVAMTVTTTGTNCGGAAGIYVLVITGVDTSTPIDVIAEASNAGGVISIAIVTATNDVWCFLVATDWNVAANMVAGASQTAIVATGIGAGPDMRVYVGRQNSTTPTAGTSVTVSTASPAAANTNNYIAFGIRAAAGGGPTPISVADAGSAADAMAATAAVSPTDAGSSAEALAAAAAVPLADGGAAADALVAGIAIPLTDTGSASDALTVTVAVPLGDAGDAGHTLAVTAALAFADAAAALEALGVAATVPLVQVASATDGLTVDTSGGGSTLKQLADAGHATDGLHVARRVLRPNTGLVVRPNTGTVTRPNTGTVVRP